ncbi:MAG: DUF4340 domain-containing protein [Bryobacteraceae bacterium]
MKVSGLLLAVGILAALGGGVYWSELKRKADEGKPAADAPPKILTIAEDQFKELRLEKTGGEPILLTRGEADKWAIQEPTALPADQDSVGSLVSTLASLASDRLVEEKAADLAVFGLHDPTLEVAITKKDGKTEKLLVGDDSPTGSSVFAKLENDPRIFTIATYVKSSLDKKTADLRDRRLLTFDSDKLTRVELAAKGPSIEFGKNNRNEWQILKPRPLRADGSQVEELIRKLKDAKMDLADEEATKKAAAAFASGARVAVVTVSDANGNQQIEVRRDSSKNYYAKSSVVPGLYKVGSDVGEGLDKDLDSFRNKKLFDFAWNEPTKVEIRDGDKQASYQKSGEKWMAGSKQMDSASVQNLIDKLRDLSAVKFAVTGGGQPVFEAAVTSNDGKRVEKVVVAKQDAAHFATRANEAGVYELDDKTVEEMRKAAADIKEHQPPKDEKKK